jgi:tRNA pseudouridine65 synthase
MPLNFLSHLPVLYRDEHFIAVNKPADLLVHRTYIDRERDVALQRVRDQIGQRVYPLHRLDRATSGVLVFGLSPEAAGALAEQVRGREIRKDYLAVVRGWPQTEGLIERPLKNRGSGEMQDARTA